jgi:hypothetical protein
MSFDDLTNDNIMLYAIKSYDKPNMLMSEFKEDMKRFNYLKRLFRRYRKDNDLKNQLILNHIVVLSNVFGAEVITRLLFFKMAKEDYSAIKTYLLFLSHMPDIVRGIRGQNLLSSDIPVDMNIANTLRKIK